MERFVRQSEKFIFALRPAGGVKFLFVLPFLLALSIFSIACTGALESEEQNSRPALSWKYFPVLPQESSGTLTDPESPDAQAELGETLFRIFRQSIRNTQLHRDALRRLQLPTTLFSGLQQELPRKTSFNTAIRRGIQNFAAETYLQNSLPVRAGPTA